MTLAVRIRDLGKQYNAETWGVRNITIDFAYGTFVALLGANGAGKSSFIHLLSGATNFTEGSISLNRNGVAPADFKLGWCSQQLAIDWTVSVYQNVMLGPRLAGYDLKKSATMTQAALKLVGLEDLATKQPDQLSGGQQQRVQIARALSFNPQILLLDEPTTGLDPKAAGILLEELVKRARAGAFVLVSSHDLSLVEIHCDAVMFLAGGKLLTFEPREVFLERFAGEEIFEIKYEGILSEEVCNLITARGIRIITSAPLELAVKRGTTIGELTALLDDRIKITDFHRKTPGLREAYLALAALESGESEEVNVQ